jgi:hypothetical protein
MPSFHENDLIYDHVSHLQVLMERDYKNILYLSLLSIPLYSQYN